MMDDTSQKKQPANAGCFFVDNKILLKPPHQAYIKAKIPVGIKVP
jgi:hypothetical protein